MFFTRFMSPVGEVIVQADSIGVTGVWFEQHTTCPKDLGIEQADQPWLTLACQQLQQYFAGQRQSFDVPLNPAGTDFQQGVWQALQTIPYGRCCSYQDIAYQIGKPSASRAVGTANGKNPISILVPCHRVIGASGKLTGYAGGLERKRWLLAHEARISPLFPEPTTGADAAF